MITKEFEYRYLDLFESKFEFRSYIYVRSMSVFRETRISTTYWSQLIYHVIYHWNEKPINNDLIYHVIYIYHWNENR